MTSTDPSERRSNFIDLAAQELGGAVIYTNDDFFASKDNLIKPTTPIWLEDEYTDRGKWMDGWESKRRRVPGNDFCLIKLGLPGVIKEVLVDTAYFRGNYPDACSLEGCVAHANATPEDLRDAEWFTIVENSKLEGHSKAWFDVSVPRRVTHIRFQIYPDGGVARLRVYGEVLPDLNRFRSLGQIDLAAMNHGGRTLAQSDMFFGVASNLLKPARGKNMGDGWESKRRRGPGHDWCLIKLSTVGNVERVELDTNHFKGNYPDRFSLSFTSDLLPENALGADIDNAEWVEAIGETKLQAHTQHIFDLESNSEARYALLKIYPDGGVSRLRLFGTISQIGWSELGITDLNCSSEQSAQTKLLSCCGSTKWADAMLDARPFDEWDSLLSTAKSAFDALSDDDWLEAFQAHPKIGEKKSVAKVTKKSANWSTGEQAGTADASQDTMTRLADGNARYWEKFDFIFIVFASGKSAFEMVQLLEQRLENDRETEIKNASIEQRKITTLRLQKMMMGE